MPPRHQGCPQREAQVRVGGGHAGHSAMDGDKPCNQVKFLLTVIKTTGEAWVIR